MLEALGLLKQGGIVMFPIALCSLIAVTIVVERSLALRRGRVIQPAVLRILDSYQSEDEAAHALALCQRNGGAFARIIEEILAHRRLGHAQSVESMRAVGRSQVGRLERGLTVLEIVAAISPLLGLMGTVLGMVTIFEAITESGLGNPRVLADGIGKALITTIAGLAVAIPALAFHSILARRVEELAVEMQDRATRFLVKVQALRGQIE